MVLVDDTEEVAVGESGKKVKIDVFEGKTRRSETYERSRSDSSLFSSTIDLVKALLTKRDFPAGSK